MTDTMLPPYAGFCCSRRPALAMSTPTQSAVIPKLQVARRAWAVVAAAAGRGDRARRAASARRGHRRRTSVQQLRVVLGEGGGSSTRYTRPRLHIAPPPARGAVEVVADRASATARPPSFPASVAAAPRSARARPAGAGRRRARQTLQQSSARSGSSAMCAGFSQLGCLGSALREQLRALSRPPLVCGSRDPEPGTLGPRSRGLPARVSSDTGLAEALVVLEDRRSSTRSIACQTGDPSPRLGAASPPAGGRPTETTTGDPPRTPSSPKSVCESSRESTSPERSSAATFVTCGQPRNAALRTALCQVSESSALRAAQHEIGAFPSRSPSRACARSRACRDQREHAIQEMDRTLGSERERLRAAPPRPAAAHGHHHDLVREQARRAAPQTGRRRSARAARLRASASASPRRTRSTRARAPA